MIFGTWLAMVRTSMVSKSYLSKQRITTMNKALEIGCLCLLNPSNCLYYLGVVQPCQISWLPFDRHGKDQIIVRPSRRFRIITL